MYGGGNWEFEYYTNNRSNSYVRDGILYIKPTLTNNTYTAPNFVTTQTLSVWGSEPADMCTSNADYGCSRQGTGSNPVNPVQSARLRSVKSFNFKYGKIEILAQLPQGDWLWPAIWMIPRYNEYGDWPASGEIDIIEARANKQLTTQSTFMDGANIGIQQMGTTLHWGPYYGADRYNMTHAAYTLPNSAYFSDAFHNWTVEWTPEGFTMSVDEYVYFNKPTPSNGYWNYGNFDEYEPFSSNPWIGSNNTNAPFDQEFYLVINLAVGGTAGFFPDGSVSTPGNGLPSYTKPWSDTSTTAYADFWNSHNLWYPTWYPFTNNGENAALKVDYIKVWSYDQ